MGTKHNIVIDHNGSPSVWLYTHWCGRTPRLALRDAIKKYPNRWNEPTVLTTLVVVELLKIAPTEGVLRIGTALTENDYGILLVESDCITLWGPADALLIFNQTPDAASTRVVEPPQSWSLQEFAALDNNTLLELP